MTAIIFLTIGPNLVWLSCRKPHIAGDGIVALFGWAITATGLHFLVHG